MSGRAPDGDPPQLAEFFKRGPSAKSPPAAILLPAERHLRLVMNRRAVDVANSKFQPLGDPQRFAHITAENRAGKSVRRIVRDARRVIRIVGQNNRNDRAEDSSPYTRMAGVTPKRTVG